MFVLFRNLWYNEMYNTSPSPISYVGCSIDISVVADRSVRPEHRRLDESHSDLEHGLLRAGRRVPDHLHAEPPGANALKLFFIIADAATK